MPEPSHQPGAREPHPDAPGPHDGQGGADAPVTPEPRGGLTATGGIPETLADISPAERAGEYPPLPGYEILGRLGQGGMGTVYRARHLQLYRLVAVKMLRAGTEADLGERARFRREAEAVARLQHPNIVQIYDVGECGGRPYFAMELVDGGNLAERLAGQPCPPREAARLAEVLARAVHHAHQRGILHRDLKPANVLLAACGLAGSPAKPQAAEPVPKITDFGLAKCLDNDAGLTQTGAIVGTPAYMAPEQAAGRVHDIGPAADVWALGAILYEALTGRPPFKAATMLETLEQVRTGEPVPPRRLVPGVPRDLETVCLKCLAKEPARRYPSALALAQDLELFAAGEPIRARPEGRVARLWRKARRRPLALVSVLVLAVAGLVAGAVGLSASRDREIAVLVNEIETGLKAPQLTEEYLRGMESRIAELRELLPDKAAAAKQRLHQGYAERVRDEFRERLNPEQAAPLEAAIARLRPRDPALADALAKEVGQRLDHWQQVFRLEAPFADLDRIFPGAPNFERPGPGDVVLRRGPKAGPYVRGQLTWAGNGKLVAVFDPSWVKAAQFGLGWKVGDRSYWFLLTVPEAFKLLGDWTPRHSTHATFADSRRDNKPVVLQILSDRARLVQTPVPAAALFADRRADAPLRLEVRREGARLTFRVNDNERTEVRFAETFPVSLKESVNFALNWPEGVGLVSLQADRLLGPAAPSKLEKGDDLFNRRDFEGAYQWYQQAGRIAHTDAVRREIRYKEGLCLLALKQREQAVRVFQALSAEGDADAAPADGMDWPALAKCQLLLAYQRDNTPGWQDAVDELLDKLLDRKFPPGKFAEVIAAEDREVLLGLRPLHANPGLLRKPDELLRQYERSDKAAALFEPTETSRLAHRHNLVKVYALVGREVEALRESRRLRRDFRAFCESDGPWATWVMDQHCWLLRRSAPGAVGARLALKELDEWLFPRPDVMRQDAEGRPMYYHLIERARIHVALGKWAEAEQDLALFFQMQKDASHRDYGFHAAASLLQGFLREKRGDKDGARTAWRRGLGKPWEQADPGGEARLLLAADLAGAPSIALVHFMIMAARVGEFKDDLGEQITNRLLFRSAGPASVEADPAIEMLIKKLKPPPGALRDMWLTERGREWAWRIACRDLSYAEYLSTPALLVAAEVLRQQAFRGPTTREQDDLLWKLVQDTVAAYANGTLKRSDLMALGGAWILGFGWEKLDKDVLRSQPHLRGPLAYLLGHRWGKNAARAATYFTIARDSQPDNAVLRRLAQAELDRLKAPK